MRHDQERSAGNPRYWAEARRRGLRDAPTEHGVPQVGRRVRVVGEIDDPHPLPIGTTGTVTSVHHVGRSFTQVSVAWDNGRGLLRRR